MSAETTRATVAEGALAGSVIAETSRATTAEAVLATSISTETTRAATVESSLATSTANSAKDVAAALGGGASVGADGHILAPSYTVQGAGYSNVGSALSAEDVAVSSLSKSVSALAADMGVFNSRLNAVQSFAYQARNEARQGIAGAMAMASASMPSAPGRTSWVVNVADYRDQGAFGGSLAHRFDSRVPLAITAGFAVSGAREAGARVGLAGEF